MGLSGPLLAQPYHGGRRMGLDVEENGSVRLPYWLGLTMFIIKSPYQGAHRLCLLEMLLQPTETQHEITLNPDPRTGEGTGPA